MKFVCSAERADGAGGAVPVASPGGLLHRTDIPAGHPDRVRLLDHLLHQPVSNPPKLHYIFHPFARPKSLRLKLVYERFACAAVLRLSASGAMRVNHCLL